MNKRSTELKLFLGKEKDGGHMEEFETNFWWEKNVEFDSQGRPSCSKADYC